MFFCPCHITAVFRVHKSKDTLSTGTTGYGFSINKGVTTRAEKGALRIFVNGKEYNAKVTKKVCELLGVKATLHQQSDLPAGYGFGISAAAALSTALELSDVFELGLTRQECGQAAHKAEVACLTGMGDVIGAYYGGFERRVRPGAPGIGAVEKQNIDAKRVVVGSFKDVPTKGVLSGDLSRINEFGEKHIVEFRPTPEYFCDSSLAFAHEIGLVDEEFDEIIRAVQDAGVRVGVSMLGKTLFSFDDCEDVFKKHLHNVTTCGIDALGARALACTSTAGSL